MAVELIENILDQIVTELQDGTNGINAKITSINTEKGDFTTEPVPTANYYKHKNNLIPEFPSIEAFPIDSPGNDESFNSINVQHEVGIRIKVYDVDGQSSRPFLKTYRYLRAIVECIKTTDSLTDNFDLCEFNGIEYEEPEQGDNGTIYGGTVKFLIQNEEVVQ